MALGSAEKKEIVTKFGRKEGDTGSPEVQIALLSKRIVDLTEHLKSNAKDHSSRLGLLKLVGQRKRLMQYLKRTDFVTYTKIIKELSIRDKLFFDFLIFTLNIRQNRNQFLFCLSSLKLSKITQPIIFSLKSYIRNFK